MNKMNNKEKMNNMERINSDINLQGNKIEVHIVPGIKTFKVKYTPYTYHIRHCLNCLSTWVVYYLECVSCVEGYVGSTEQTVFDRIINGHFRSFMTIHVNSLADFDKNEYVSSPLLQHITLHCQNSNCGRRIHKFKVIILERVVEDIPTINPYHIDYVRKARGVMKIREQYW